MAAGRGVFMNNEPVAWMGKDYDGFKTNLYFNVERNKLPYRLYESAIPLYTHPHPDNLGFAESIIKQQQAEIEALKEKLNEAIDAEKDRRFE